MQGTQPFEKMHLYSGCLGDRGIMSQESVCYESVGQIKDVIRRGNKTFLCHYQREDTRDNGLQPELKFLIVANISYYQYL